MKAKEIIEKLLKYTNDMTTRTKIEKVLLFIIAIYMVKFLIFLIQHNFILKFIIQ